MLDTLNYTNIQCKASFSLCGPQTQSENLLLSVLPVLPLSYADDTICMPQNVVEWDHELD